MRRTEAVRAARRAALPAGAIVACAALALSAWTTAPEPAPGPDADAAAADVSSALRSAPDGLAEAASAIAACDCAGVVYLWSPALPLSRRGIAHVARATEALGVRLTLLRSEELAEYASRPVGPAATPLAEAMLAAGALAHAPALLVHDRGEVVGPALLGYKTSDAYRSAIERRLERGFAGALPPRRAPAWSPEHVEDTRPAVVDHAAVGVPGAYFRWVPGRGALAYESGRRVYLLDLDDGVSRLAPGYIDFVPTPDGRYFVTPGVRDSGLVFYDAEDVFRAARRDRAAEVEPIFTDARMRDQYPSVGILHEEGGRTRYRVLTSWFEGIVYRDYDVFVDEASGVSSVRPVGQPVVPCAGASLSTPIMSQDGLEVAARDEVTGTTKIFEILDGGRCEEALDLGVATSKVAWHRTGAKLAFRLPRVRNARAGIPGGEEGVFLYDRDRRRLTGVAGSANASTLAFPEFVGDDRLAFLIPGRTRRDPSVFRVVDGVR